MDKIVDFSKCNDCLYLGLAEYESPCFECLNAVAREDSHMPINYKRREKAPFEKAKNIENKDKKQKSRKKHTLV